MCKKCTFWVACLQLGRLLSLPCGVTSRLCSVNVALPGHFLYYFGSIVYNRAIVYKRQNFHVSCPRDSHWLAKSNRELDELQVTVIYSRATSLTFVFPLPLGVWEGLRFLTVALSGIFSHHFFQSAVDRGLSDKPGLDFWTFANSADPDQTPQNAASDQRLHRLLKLQKVKG